MVGHLLSAVNVLVDARHTDMTCIMQGPTAPVTVQKKSRH